MTANSFEKSQPISSKPTTSDTSSTFSIATSAVTSAFSINDSLTDTSFTQSTPVESYHQTQQSNITPLKCENALEEQQKVTNEVLILTINDSTIDADATATVSLAGNNIQPIEPLINGEQNHQSNVDSKLDITQHQPGTSFSASVVIDAPKTAYSSNSNIQDDNNHSKKRRSKTAKKNTKMDAKSKLEKSRQSARECRARKKLRYQYLEDLVCNREKAVIKLREELSVFCDFSRQIDSATISDSDRQMLIEQTKENNK